MVWIRQTLLPRGAVVEAQPLALRRVVADLKAHVRLGGAPKEALSPVLLVLEEARQQREELAAPWTLIILAARRVASLGDVTVPGQLRRPREEALAAGGIGELVVRKAPSIGLAEAAFA